MICPTIHVLPASEKRFASEDQNDGIVQSSLQTLVTHNKIDLPYGPLLAIFAFYRRASSYHVVHQKPIARLYNALPMHLGSSIGTYPWLSIDGAS